MPIPGLLSQAMPTFPKIGDIRKGAKKTDPKKPGPDLTYFRYVLIPGEEEAALKFHEVYGDEPREINIFLPFDEIDRNFEAFMERHTAGALQCRGSIEGDVCYMWRDDEGVMHREQKQCPTPICEGCKETGRLKIIIPELRRLAYVVVHTTSIWDIVELRNNLVALRKLTGNGLKGIPLVLKRRPRMISTPRANGKRVRQEKWMLSIEADGRWVDAQLKAMEAAALPAGHAVLSLPEPETEADGETDEIVAAGEYEDPDDVPPPFNDDDEPASPEAETSGGNGNQPEPEEAKEGPNLPDKWTAFAHKAVKELYYPNINAVYNAMKKITGDPHFIPSKADGSLTGDAADWWAALQTSAARPEAI